MKRTLTILVVGLLVAVLTIGGIAPAVSAHGDTDTEQTPYAEPTTADNQTSAYAAAMTQWMQTRMGPEGVEAFEDQTGTSIETVAYAMAEQMGPQTGTWNDSVQQTPYSQGWNNESQAHSGYGYQGHGSNYGPQMPHGPHMAPNNGYGPGMFGGGYGPGMFGGGYGPGMFGGQSQGFFGGFGNGVGPGGSGYGGHGGGHGMSGHGMGGGR
jgi:hypothetical protein